MDEESQSLIDHDIFELIGQLEDTNIEHIPSKFIVNINHDKAGPAVPLKSRTVVQGS